MAELQGFSDYPFATVPHPVTSLTLEQVHALADRATAEIEALLIGGALASSSATSGGSLPDLVEELASGLRSDGANLTADRVDDQIIFELHIPDRACADCIMPASILLPMYDAQVRSRLGANLTSSLLDPRNERDHPLNRPSTGPGEQATPQ